MTRVARSTISLLSMTWLLVASAVVIVSALLSSCLSLLANLFLLGQRIVAVLSTRLNPLFHVVLDLLHVVKKFFLIIEEELLRDVRLNILVVVPDDGVEVLELPDGSEIHGIRMPVENEGPLLDRIQVKEMSRVGARHLLILQQKGINASKARKNEVLILPSVVSEINLFVFEIDTLALEAVSLSNVIQGTNETRSVLEKDGTPLKTLQNSKNIPLLFFCYLSCISSFYVFSRHFTVVEREGFSKN